MIKQIKMLSVSDCAQIKDKVYSLREDWTGRGMALAALEDLGFYTLGNASYLDISGPDQPTSYYAQSAITNRVLLENFPELYTELLSLIETEFGYPAVYHPGFALPGFHIYEADYFFTESFAPYHFDLHHYLLDWQGLGYDKENTLSFTLAIDLPKSGAELHFWPEFKFIEPNLDNPDYKKLRQRMFDVDLSKESKELYQHKIGYVLFHTGMLYHQMAAMPEMDNGEARITLQGHGVLGSDNKWHLFW